MSEQNNDAPAKGSKRPLPHSVSDPLAQFEAAVHDIEEQVREVNARIDKKAGRPLWLAITFGLLLGGVFVGSLFLFGELFMVFVTALVLFATLELAGALVEKGRLKARWPLALMASAMPPLVFFFARGRYHRTLHHTDTQVCGLDKTVNPDTLQLQRV